MSAPDDVAVVGFDNVPMAEFSVPALTTVEPGTDQIAKHAVDLLAARVEGRDGAPSELFTDFSLVVRRSHSRPQRRAMVDPRMTSRTGRWCVPSPMSTPSMASNTRCAA